MATEEMKTNPNFDSLFTHLAGAIRFIRDQVARLAYSAGW
jgi:hypothetical protein